MHPAYFAMAMATGVVAIACHLFGLREFAAVLSVINLCAYPTLWVLFIARAALFPRRVAADLHDHARAPGYFTMVAATGVLGTQAVLLHGRVEARRSSCGGCAVALWAACTYTVFALLTVARRRSRPWPRASTAGGWLPSWPRRRSAVLGCVLDGAFLGDRDLALFVLMCFWLGGGMLYLWIIGLIFYRYMFFRFLATTT